MYGGIPGSIGIKNLTNGAQVSLTLGLKLQIKTGTTWIDVSSPGIIVADAESLTSTGTETIQGTITSNSNAWELIDYNIGALAAASASTYRIQVSNSVNQRTFRAYNTAATGTGDQQESTVMLARGATSMDLVMKGNGLQIAAFGFMMPFDYGDLPLSYGSVAHYIPLLDNNGQATALPNDTYNPKTATIPAYTSRATIKLGEAIDADNGDNFTANADGDDNTGIDDEDGISNAVLNNINVATTAIGVTANNTSTNIAYLHAWLDKDQNGIFEAADKLSIATNTVPANSTNLSRDISLPTGLKAGQFYSLRVRIATGSTHEDPQQTAPDGEVEDYRIFIKGYTISGNVVNDNNGITDGVTGSALGAPSGTPLYAYLIDNNGTIINKTLVDATTGAYSFEDVNPGDYTVKISSNTALATETTPLAESYTLPDAWSNSAQRDGDNSVTAAGYSSVSISTSDDVNTPKTVTQGLNEKPVARNSSYTLSEQPASKDRIPLNNSLEVTEGGNMDKINYNDPDGGAGLLTVTITSLPVTNGDNSPANLPVLLYDGVPVTQGVPIPNFDPLLLSVEVNGVGYNSLNFKFTVTDAAGATSDEATYSFQWQSALPVSLTSFKGINVENQVFLTWSTVSETNSEYFEVQRLTASEWVSLGSIAAGYNSTSPKDYDFTDANPSERESVYRLKMVDLDGTFTYSRLIAVRVDIVSRFYPNPVQDYLHIDVADWSQVARVSILDYAGKYLYASGEQTAPEVDVRGFIPGNYLVKVEYTNGTVITKRILIVR